MREDEYLFIVYDHRRQWLRQLKRGSQFHSDKGFLCYDDLVNKPIGYTYFLEPHKKKVAIVSPLICDYIYHMKRESQIIYPEDLGLLLFYSGVNFQSRVLEAGTGSGTVSGVLAAYCRPQGHLYTYEVREQALSQAKENMALIGNIAWISAFCDDIIEHPPQLQDLDFIILDLATPWLAIAQVTPCLSPSGRVCLFSPTLEQVKKNMKSLTQLDYKLIVTVEILKRVLQIKPNASRPVGRMVAHTGYLTFASRSSRPPLPISYTEAYSPENIGYLILGCGIQQETRILFLGPNNSPILSYYEYLFNSLVNIVTEPRTVKFKENLDSPDQKEIYDVILIDPNYEELIPEKAITLLKPGGVVGILSSTLEHVKQYYLPLQDAKFILLETCEFLKLSIVCDNHFQTTSTTQCPHAGYITIGRRIIDELEDLSHIPTELEFVEPILEVARDFKDSLPEEPEKIDFANQKEDDS